MSEVIGWIQIVFFPLSITAIIGFFVYISNPTKTRFIIGIIITTIGLASGIFWATRIWKKKGTINFISRVNATPELDNLDQE
jgi:hypothetical protein